MDDAGDCSYEDAKGDHPAAERDGRSRRQQNETEVQDRSPQHLSELAQVENNVPALANRPGGAVTITGHGNTMIGQQTVHVSGAESGIPQSLQEFFKYYFEECIRFRRNEFVETRGGTKALKMVKVEHIVSVIGSPGGGKSSIVKWLVIELFTDEYEIIVIRSIEEWRKYVNPARKQIVVIEDIFGSSQFDSNNSKAWLGLALEIQLAMQNGLIYVVITSRTAIYNEAGILSSQSAFLHIVDLNDEMCKLTPTEKKNMLLHHMALNKRSTSSMKDKEIPYVGENIIGFPECCRLFCTDNDLHRMGLDFFTKPSRYLKEVLQSMSRKMRDKFTALVYCMLHGGAIPTRCCEVTGKCPKLKIAWKSCGLKGDESVKIVTENMDILMNSFLLSGEKGTAYKIQHQTLIYAVVDVFCNDCRGHDIVIKHADLKFIANNVQIADWKVSHQNPISTDNQDFEQLWIRIMIELSIESRQNLVMESILWKHDGFVRYCIDRLMKEDKLVNFLEQNSYFLLKYNFHEHSDEIGCYNMNLINIIIKAEVVDHLLNSAKENRRMLISYILLWSSALKNNNEVTLKLLSEDSNPNIKGHCDITPIHCAVLEGSVATVQELLRRGATQTATESRKNTPLHIAALLGRNDIITLLIEHGARLNDINSNHNTALHFASLNGHTETVELLLKHNASLIAVNEHRSTPLHLACTKDHTDTARLLLAHDASISAVDKWGRTPLHSACCHDHTDTVTLLLEHNASISTVTQQGATSLHVACHNGYKDTVNLLLEHNASLSIFDQWGYTPLHRASLKGHIDIVTMLLKHHASLSAVDHWWKTPLHRACQEGHVDTVSLLLAHHANVSAVNMNGDTPLHAACQNGHIDTVRLLLEHRASLSAVDQQGCSPLHMACQKGHIDTIRLLLAHHASISGVDKDGDTLLHAACSGGYVDSVRLLLEHHASISAVAHTLHFIGHAKKAT